MCRFGDIYIADMNMEGNLQQVEQPVMVVSNDRTNKNSSVVTVVPVANASEKDKLAGYVLTGDYGLSGKNIAVIGQINTLNQTQLLSKIGSIRGTVYEAQIKQAVKKYLGL